MNTDELSRFFENHEDAKEYYIEKLILSVVTQIRRFMRENKVTQDALAERLGVSQAEVSKLLSRDRNLTLKTIALIAHSLEAEWQNLRLKAIEKSDKMNISDSTTLLDIDDVGSVPARRAKGVMIDGPDLANAA
jgi:transcriptional regulator with XRE-family HTH domain